MMKRASLCVCVMCIIFIQSRENVQIFYRYFVQNCDWFSIYKRKLNRKQVKLSMLAVHLCICFVMSKKKSWPNIIVCILHMHKVNAVRLKEKISHHKMIIFFMLFWSRITIVMICFCLWYIFMYAARFYVCCNECPARPAK